MKTYTTAYLNHLLQPNTTLAFCWVIEKKDGTFVRGTTHDRDIVIEEGDSPGNPLAGRYLKAAGIIASEIKSASDMSVDNMEVQGGLSPDLHIDLNVPDIESGLFDDAAVQTFRVNWQDPNDYQEIFRRGYLGQIERTAEGQYRTEVRGLTQALQQMIGQTAGDRCNVRRFGDERCKFNVADATASGVVTGVTSSRRFDSTLTQGSTVIDSPHFRLGRLLWLTGANAGYEGQVKLDNVGGTLGNLEMWEPFFYDVDIGDTFSLEPGCDRSFQTCRDVYANWINFRGAGLLCPGPDSIIRAP